MVVRSLISVLMLTYNRENMVARAIESILAQTYTNFEFIIVDNGSTDSSGRIADEYAAKDDRIKVIHRERGSIGAGRNTALDEAKGDYIAFVDDDDYITPDYLEFLYSLIVENNADIAVCGSSVKTFDKKMIMSAEKAMEIMLWRTYFNVGFPTKLINKDLFKNVRFSEQSKYDDIYLMPQIVAESKKVVYYGLSKYIIERHSNNNSAWTQNHELLDVNTLQEYLDVYKERTKWLCEKYPLQTTVWYYFKWSFMISMVEKIDRLHIQGCDLQLKQMITELTEYRNEFLEFDEIQDYEKEWIKKYIA